MSSNSVPQGLVLRATIFTSLFVRLSIGKKFFTMRALRHWNRLSREGRDAPSLEVYKVRLDGAVGNQG